MMLDTRVRPLALLLAAWLACGAAAAALAADPKTTADDKCTAQCDEESDRCMQAAGKDSAKQKQCDSSYDECLRKCQ
ncbi:MAG TPA: hypothetical protein VMU00_06140 [Steroidobacteraceae bacterium]|nr:hypothetical protein [Steroidobacteraceae bacterium]